MRWYCSLIVVSCAVACGGDKETDSGAEAANLQPTEGEWTWDDVQYTQDECGMSSTFSPEVLDAVPWTLVITDQGFQVTTATYPDVVDCVLSGIAFTCTTAGITTEPDSWPEGSGQTGDPDVTTTLTASFVGTLTDSGSSNGTAEFVGTCDGPDCEAYGTAIGAINPCTSIVVGGFNLSE